MARLGFDSWSTPLLRSSSLLSPVSRHEDEEFADEEKQQRQFNGLKIPENDQNKKQNEISAKLHVVTFIVILFIGASIMSCVAPFFPNRAMEKGVSQTMVGFIMGVTAIVTLISTWFFAVFIFDIGIKFMLCFGMFWAGICAILFGVVDFCPPGDSFTALSFIVRAFEGVGLAMYFISSYTISGILFADNYAFVMGLLETSVSLGTLLGPSIGGALFAAGGYFLPFVVLGGTLLLLDPFAIFMIPSNIAKDVDTSSDEHNPIRVLCRMINFRVTVTTYAMLSATVSWIFTETTLGVRLAAFNVTDPLIVGSIYLASSGAFAISAPLSGRLADKFNNGWPIMIFGTVLLVIGYLIIGPSPILLAKIIPEGLTQLIIGCLCTHTGLAAVVVPTTKALQKEAETSGLDPNSVGTLAFITALFQSVWSLGGFIGAVISSSLMEYLGYGWATTIQAGIILSSLLLQICAVFRMKNLTAKISSCFTRKHRDYESLR